MWLVGGKRCPEGRRGCGRFESFPADTSARAHEGVGGVREEDHSCDLLPEVFSYVCARCLENRGAMLCRSRPITCLYPYDVEPPRDVTPGAPSPHP